MKVIRATSEDAILPAQANFRCIRLLALGVKDLIIRHCSPVGGVWPHLTGPVLARLDISTIIGNELQLGADIPKQANTGNNIHLMAREAGLLINLNFISRSKSRIATRE